MLKEERGLLMKRSDRQVAVLQCIEAMRLHAAAHDGKFPDTLSESKVKIPPDPVTKKAFIYRASGASAVLQTPAPKGVTPENMKQYKLTQYKLTLKK